MTWLRVLVSRALDVIFRRTRDDRLAEEIRVHLDLLTNEYATSGMPIDEARLAARRTFGGVDRVTTICREQRTLALVGQLSQDLRYAVRVLAKDRLFTLAAVGALALGIGANTAVFSLIESLVLRPLPVDAPARLAIVADSSDTSRRARSYAVWQAIWSRRAIFDGVLAWTPARFDLGQGGEAQLVDGIWISGSTFETLGVRAMLGRTITEHDDSRGGGPDGPAIVISHGFWRRHFGGAADIIGRSLALGGVPYTIVGVTPPQFFGLDVGRSFDIAVPIGTEPLVMGDEAALDDRSVRWLTIMARLKSGQATEEAVAALRAVQSQIREETLPDGMRPADSAEYLKSPLTLVPSSTGVSSLRGRYQRSLLTILAVVALVLLIACANVANLLLARATARRHEFAVRLAMGASRWRLVRQLLVESFLLSMAGAMLGLVLAQWASRLLVQALSTPANPVFLDLSLDGRVLLFTSVVAIATTLLFGIAPALRAAGSSPIEAIKDRGRGVVRGGGSSIANSLIVGQVALSVVLVVAAGLFLQTFSSLMTRDLGFDREHVLLVEVNARRSRAVGRERLATFGQLRDRVLALPGVSAAAVSLEVPLASGAWENRVNVSNSVALADEHRRSHFNAVTPGWFTTFGVPILAGRDISERDQWNATPVIVVNEAFARRFFDGASPLGQTVAIQYGNRGMPPREIVGLVANAVYNSPRQEPPPTMYVPLAQFATASDVAPPAGQFATPSDSAPSWVSVSIRVSAGSPELLARSIGDAIAGADRDLALTFRPLASQFDASLTRERVVAALASVFGVLALLLAALGLYGVTSYAVTQRRPELGVRMAMGAAPSAVIGLVLSRVSALIGLGVVIGLGLSVWATQLVAPLLFGLEPHDPFTLAGAALTLALVGLIAGWIPARRAARIDPLSVLRET